jgi:nucleotide-binding universal stress UspA family protein
MVPMETVAQVHLDNILYLTDFSAASEAAAPFVKSIARQYGSELFVLHVVKPDPFVCMAPECADAVNAGMTEEARIKMQQVSASFETPPCQAVVENGAKVWPSVREYIERYHIDLVCVGTHGRSGLQKLWLGSVAEEVFRRSRVPVLTVGPLVTDRRDEGRFQSILFATDFEAGSSEALGYAVSMARQHHSRLVLLHVINRRRQEHERGLSCDPEVTRRLKELLLHDASLISSTELIVKYGDPAVEIIEVAREWRIGLVVLGIHAAKHLAVPTHLKETTAHCVASFAPCPVLTVRAQAGC